MRRTWLIGPDGHTQFMLGVNTVMRDTQIADTGAPRCVGIGNYIRRHPPGIAAQVEWARLSTGQCAGQTVAKPYGFNSVGAFSETNDFDTTGGDSYMIRPPTAGGAGAPYAVVVNVKARAPDRALKDEHGTALRGGFTGFLVGDPFNPLFLSDLDDAVAGSVAPRRADPQLQMWFAGNEIGIFDIGQHGGPGVRDFRRWIWSDVPVGSTIDRPACARHRLARFLRDTYEGSISALNAAWDSAYPDFSAIVDVGPRPVPYVHDCNARAGEDLQRFVHDRLLREWVRAVTSRIRAADPHHLIASPRLAITDPRLYRFWSGRGQPNPISGSTSPRSRSETTPRPSATARSTFFAAMAKLALISSPSTSTPAPRSSPVRGSPTGCTRSKTNPGCRSSSASSGSGRGSTTGQTRAAHPPSCRTRPCSRTSASAASATNRRSTSSSNFPT
jgi:hypothetical protein